VDVKGEVVFGNVGEGMAIRAVVELWWVFRQERKEGIK